jgi:tetratricopeptide (TPR) repeat protein
MMQTMVAGAVASDMDRGGFEDQAAETVAFIPKPPAAVRGAAAAPGAQARSHWKTAKTSLAVRSLGRRDKTGRMLARKTVGRDAELKDLKRKLKNLSRGEDGGILMYEGGAGLGKSHMCREAIKHADRLGLRPLRGFCSALKDSTPYFPFQCLLEELFQVTFLPIDEARAKILEQVEEQWPHLFERVGLLNAVLPFHFDESMQVSVLTGFARLEGTKRYLLELLQCATQSLEKLVLIFEDVHWMDSLSWGLLADVSSSIHPLLIIATHREWPEEFPPPVEYMELLQSERTKMYPLKGLSRHQTAELSTRVLRVDELPEVVLAAIVNRGGGNPFYVEEAVKYMKDKKVILLQGKPLKCTTGHDFGARGKMPDNGLAMVTERFHSLDEPLRLILKVGAVIGGAFTEAMLKGVHPFPSQLSQLSANMDKLARMGFIATDMYQRVLDDSWDKSDEPETLYSFNHSILEDMVYQLMPLAQRQELHRAAARYYEAAQSRMKMYLNPEDSDSSDSEDGESIVEEQTEDEKIVPGFALALAHHWSHTSEPPMAASFLVEAGRDALRRHGNMEAVEHFQQAFDLVPEGRAAHVTVSRAKLFVMAGDAFFSLGQTDMAENHYREGLRLMAQPFLTKVPLGIRLPLRTMVSQKLVLLKAARMVRRSSSSKSIMIEDEDAAHCFERLAKVHENRKWLTLLMSLKHVQLLEKCGSNPSLLRGCANVCYTAAILQKSKTAETYCKLAMQVSGQVEELSSLAHANRVCGIYSIGVGQWTRAQQMLQAGAEFSSKVHDWQGWYESVGYLALAQTLTGQFTEAEGHINMALDSVRNAGHNDSLAWVLCGYIACTYPKGPVVHQGIDNLELLEECLGSGREGEGPLPHVLLVAGKGLASIARLRRGETSAAEKLAMEHLFYVEQASHESEEDAEGRAILEQVVAENQGEDGFEAEDEMKEEKRNNQAALKSVFTALPRAAVVEVAIALWDKSLKHEHHIMAHRALASFRDMVHIFPVLRPRLHLYEGQIERLDGHTYLMMDQWRKCLVVARQMEMPWEVACAHHQLAEWGVHTKAEEELASELERRAHVSAAQRAFAELDTKERVNRVKDAARFRPHHDVFGRIGAEMREQEGAVVFDPAATNHANICVQQAATDALAVRLHLNPPRHRIERGKNKTEVWPELRHEPRKLTRLKRYLAYGLSGKRWKNRDKDNVKCGFQSVLGAILSAPFCGCWCLCPIDQDLTGLVD